MNEHSLNDLSVVDGGRVSARLVASIVSGTLLMSSAAVLSALAASDVVSWQQLQSFLSVSANTASSAIQNGYAIAPALIICLAVCALLPFVGLMMRGVSLLRRDANVTRRHRSGLGSSLSRRSSDITIDGDHGHLSPGQRSGPAFLETINGGAQFALRGEMLRVGREADNEVRIPLNTIHRYHAAIHRNDHDGWSVSDLSGRDGNGVIVNGRRCRSVALTDGDVIDIGPGRLRFRTGSSMPPRRPELG